MQPEIAQCTFIGLAALGNNLAPSGGEVNNVALYINI